MDLIKFNDKAGELPLKIFFSLGKIVSNTKESPSDQKTINILSRHPALKEGIEDKDQLKFYEKEIKTILQPLFPEALQNNEIKAVIIPFSFTGFNLTSRFSGILDQAGESFQFKLNEFDEATNYIFACSVILSLYYKQAIDFSRPLYFDIPNQKTGKIRHYRVLFNIDFGDIIKTDAAPEITQKDIEELLQDSKNIKLWKAKFPPESYIFKGFGIINLFDVTQDVIINNIRSLFLRDDDSVFKEFQTAIQQLLNVDDLMIGYSTYDTKNQESLGTFFNRGAQSLFLKENERLRYTELFCKGVQNAAMKDKQVLTISDIETYGKNSNYNDFYKRLKKQKIKSMILIPMTIGTRYLQLIELASHQKNELNSLTALKLEDIIPYVKIASQRYIKERMNVLESTIQENYTTIHPAIKWRFTDAAINFNRQKIAGEDNPTLEQITFNNVYPLYGQTDIKSSSLARNEAIKADLIMQLNLVIDTFREILKIQAFPVYKKMVYRVEMYLSNVEKGLKTGDEVSILDFLKKEIYPTFDHLKSINPRLEEIVLGYMAHIDVNLHLVYRVRKAYDESVSMLNDALADYIDNRQLEAQKMFPHYFQRYKTDGVEYNIYIGAELVRDRVFNDIYLYNLRLYQLDTMWGLEQIAHELKAEMPHPLEVASLILVHSHPLSIKFHMEQKQFDVDGAYNARYEIIKKRIDKSHVKGTNERLTQPGKLVIVYSQDADEEEYLNYLKYWKTEGLFGEIELLELEDLQGVSGLRAIRVEIVYKKKLEKKQKRKFHLSSKKP